MNDAIRKAEVLIEALSYIRRFRDKLTVIKLGGSAMEDADALRATLQDVVFMETVGLRPVLVHGGGKPIDRAMTAAGLQPRKVQGRRYTDGATLDIVVRVLRDEGSTVSSLDGAGCRDLIDRGVIDSGMIPKVEACLDSLRAGVKKTHMIDFFFSDTAPTEIYTDRGVGTEITLGQV